MAGKKQDSDSTREVVFDFLVQYKRDHDGNTPSTRDIADACCLSVSGVNYHLLRLEVADRIRISEDGRRNIEITGGTWDMIRGDITQSKSPSPSSEASAPRSQDRVSAQPRKNE